MSNTFSFNYFGSTIIAESLGVKPIPNIKKTLTAHCIPLTAGGKIVAINIIGRGIDIPGGHIEDGETVIKAMIRETQEEAQITVDSPILIDVWYLSSTDKELGLLKKPYLLVYTVKVTSMQDFVKNDEADKRLILKPEEFITQYFGDKQQIRILVDKAIASYN